MNGRNILEMGESHIQILQMVLTLYKIHRSFRTFNNRIHNNLERKTHTYNVQLKTKNLERTT